VNDETAHVSTEHGAELENQESELTAGSSTNQGGVQSGDDGRVGRNSASPGESRRQAVTEEFGSSVVMGGADGLPEPLVVSMDEHEFEAYVTRLQNGMGAVRERVKALEALYEGSADGAGPTRR
jgi:hypothetical protein